MAWRPPKPPSGEQYAEQLNSIFKGDLSFQYVHAGKKKDPGFFHVTYKTEEGDELHGNMRINLGAHSSTFSYKEGNKRRDEFIPEIVTSKGTSSFFAVPWMVSQYTDEGPSAHVIGPIRALANTVNYAMQRYEEQHRRGASGASFESNLFSVLSEGYSRGGVQVAPGGMQVLGRNDPAATKWAAANSMAVLEQVNPGSKVNEFQQRREMHSFVARNISLGGATESGIWNILNREGWGFGRENNVINRYGVKPGSGSDIYLAGDPKHDTLLRSGRTEASPYDYIPGRAPMPVQAQDPSTRGHLGGYMNIPARGPRLPGSAMVANVLLNPIGVPGGGYVFTGNLNVGGNLWGAQKAESVPITSQLQQLLGGALDLKIAGGNPVIQNNSAYEYARLGPTGGDKSSQVPLVYRGTASSFYVQQQELVLPPSYDLATGQGRAYQPGASNLVDLTESDVKRISQRYGVPARIDPLASTVNLMMTGVNKTAAKFAAHGLKIGPVESDLTPFVSVSGRRGMQHIPIGAMSFDFKSAPEAFYGGISSLDPSQQSRLLRQYAATLGDDPTRSLISQYAKSIKGRNGMPDRAIDWDELTRTVGGNTSRLDIAAGIARNVFGFGNEMTEADAVRLSRSRHNISNLENYGMGWVAPGSQIGAPLIQKQMTLQNAREMFRSYYQAAQMAAKEAGTSMSPSLIRENFRQEYGRDFARTGLLQQSATGFMMRAIVGPSAEYIGGGSFSMEEAQLVNGVSRQYARRLGIGMVSNDMWGNMADIRNPVRRAHAQVAQVMATHASDIQGNQVEIANTFKIDQAMAMRMSSDNDLMNLLDRSGSGVASTARQDELMKYLSANYFGGSKEMARRVIEFEGTGQYMPSLSAARALRTVNTGKSETGEPIDVTRMWDMWQSAFGASIRSLASGDSEGVSKAQRNLNAHYMEVYGLPGGYKSEAVKGIYGGETQRTAGRYTYGGNLRQNEIEVPDALLENMVRRELSSQVGDVSDEEVSSVVAGLKGQGGYNFGAAGETLKGGIPTLMSRYPIGGGSEYMPGMNIVTQAHLERAGRAGDKGSAMTDLVFRLGIPASNALHGDYDYDEIMTMLGLRASRGKGGKLNVNLAGINSRTGAIDPGLQRAIERTGQMSSRDMLRYFHPDTTIANSVDAMLSTMQDRFKGNGPMSAVAAMAKKQFGRIAATPYQTFTNRIEEYRAGKQNIALAYNFTRALEVSQATAGWSDKAINKMRSSRAGIYEPYLGFKSGVPVPAVKVYNSAKLGNAGRLPGMGFYRPGKTINEESRFADTSSMPIGPDWNSTSVSLGRLSGAVLTRDAQYGSLPSPRLVTSMFAPEESTAKSLYSTLNKAYHAQGTPEEVQQGYQAALTGWMEENYKDRPEMVYQGGMLSAMISKSFMKARESDPDYTLVPEGATDKERAFYTGLEERAKLNSTQFAMSKGGIRPANEMIALAKHYEGMLSINKPMSSLGMYINQVVNNTLGFAGASLRGDQGDLASRFASMPISISGSALPALLGGKQYSKEYPIPGGSHVNSGVMTSVAYQVGGLLGLKRPEILDMLNAAGAAPYGQGHHMRRGDVVEGRFDQLLTGGGGTNWFSSSLTGKKEATLATNYQGVNFTTSPDFWTRQVDKEGNPQWFNVELKARSKALKDFKNGEGEQLLHDQSIQNSGGSFAVEQLRGQILAGREAGASEEIRALGGVANRSLRATLADAGITNEQSIEEIIRGGTKSLLLNAPVGSKIYNAAMDPKTKGEDFRRLLESSITTDKSRVMGKEGGALIADIEPIGSMLLEAKQNVVTHRGAALKELVRQVKATATGPFMRKRSARSQIDLARAVGPLAGTEEGVRLQAEAEDEGRRAAASLDVAARVSPFLGRLLESFDASAPPPSSSVPLESLVAIGQQRMYDMVKTATVVEPRAKHGVASPAGGGQKPPEPPRGGGAAAAAAGGEEPPDDSGKNFRNNPLAPKSPEWYGNPEEPVPPTPYLPAPGASNVSRQGGGNYGGGLNLMEPTKQIQQYFTLYDEEKRTGRIAAAAQFLRGGDPAGTLATSFSKMSYADQAKWMAGNQEAVQAAVNLNAATKGAWQAQGSNRYDAGVLKASGIDIDHLTENIEEARTTSPLGKDMMDIINAQNSFFQNARKQGKGVEMMAAQRISAELAGDTGAKVLAALGLSGDTSFEALGSMPLGSNQIDQLRDVAKSDPGVKDLLARALKLGSAGPSGKGLTARDIKLLNAPDAIGLASMTTQAAKLYPEFSDAIKGKEGAGPGSAKAESMLSKEYAGLADAAKKLTESFTGLDKNTGKVTATMKSHSETAEKEYEIQEKRVKLAKEGSAAVELGLAEPTYDAKQRIMGFKITGKPVTVEQYKAVADAQAADASFTSDLSKTGADPKGPAGFLRKMFGGFGLMYIRSLYNIATGGLSPGMQEAQQYQGALTANASSITGFGRVDRNQSTMLANRLAQNGVPYGAVQSLAGWTQTNPTGQTFGLMVGAGAGSYALLQQMAAWNPQSSTLQNLAAPGTALGIAAATAGVSFIAEGFSRAQHVPSLIMRKGRDDTTEGLGSITDDLAGGALAWGSIFGGDEAYREFTQGLQTYKDVLALRRNRAAVGGSVSLTDLGGTPEDQAAAATYYLDQLQTENGYASLEAIGAAGSLMLRAGIPESRNAQLIAAVQSGTVSESAVSGMLSAFGVSRSKQYGGGPGMTISGVVQSMLSRPLTQTQREGMEIGNKYLSSLGDFTNYAYQAGDIGQAVNFSVSAGQNVVNTPYEDIFSQLSQLYVQRAELGMENPRTWNTDETGAIIPEDLTPLQKRQRQLDIYQQRSITDSVDEIQKTLASNMSGMTASQIQTFTAPMGSWDIGRLTQFQTSQQTIASTQQSLMSNWGLSSQLATQYGTNALAAAAAGSQTPWMSNLQYQAANWNENALTTMQAYGMALPTGQQVPWNFVQGDVSQFGATAGMPTGRPLFSTSLQWGNPQHGGLTSAQTAAMIFGEDWATGQYGGQLSDMVNGVQVPGMAEGTMVGGLMANQIRMSQLGYENQMASIGNQMAQWEAGWAFTTGEGIGKYSGTVNPQTGSPFGFNTGNFKWNIPGVGSYESQGGGLWGLQDAQRNLGYAQQEWQFGMQEKQMGLQTSQFYQNMGLQQQQSSMQRGWAREDWAFQDTSRALQWGWKQEDFQEQSRFMTGRDRRLAERQNRRETVLHDMEGEQIDKQRERQKEMWRLEDERYQVQIQQFEENKKLQEEQLQKSREFYEERKKLELEEQKLQRAMWVEMQNLAKQQIGIQAHYAEEMHKANEIQMALMVAQMESQTLLTDAQVTLGTTTVTTIDFINTVFDTLQAKLTGLLSGAGGSGESGTGGDEDIDPRGGGSNGGGRPPAVVPKPGDPAIPFALSTRGYSRGSGTGGGLMSTHGPHGSGRGGARSTDLGTGYNSWLEGGSVLRNSDGGAGERHVTIIVQVGNEEFKRYIIDTISDDLEV